MVEFCVDCNYLNEGAHPLSSHAILCHSCREKRKTVNKEKTESINGLTYELSKENSELRNRVRKLETELKELSKDQTLVKLWLRDRERHLKYERELHKMCSRLARENKEIRS
jgi:hypothetical protein